MQLRQQSLYVEAVAYYEKAFKICGEDDENLFFNLAEHILQTIMRKRLRKS